MVKETIYKDWKYHVLVIAAIYNIVWGAFVILFPNLFFDMLSMDRPRYPEIWQCVGMIVGVYGVGYYAAAKAPSRHWPIVLVGLMGKVFGPIGFAKALYDGVFPLEFGITIIFNDLIWWVPFFIILKDALFEKPTSSIKVDFEKLDKRKRAKFINSLSGFKSSNLIGTMGEFNSNLSIISSAFHLGADPALIGFIVRPDVSPRHTLNNIRQSKICTLNHVNQDILMRAHQTSARYDQKISEFEAVGLTEEFHDDFGAPFVAESNIKLGLELVREEKLEENSTHLMIMKIVSVYLPGNCILEDGHVDIEKAGTITVSGLDTYHDTDQLGRLNYAKPEIKPYWIK